MIYDTFHADKAHASDAKVPHELFLMHLTKIRIFHHFMVLAGIL